MSLPRTVWRYWTGSPEPEWMVQCGRTWDRDGWEVVTLTEPPWPLVNQHLFDQAEELAPNHVGQLRADILRLEILEREGGVWVDTDFQLLTTIDDLCGGGPWLAWELQNRVLNQAIVASPAHDAWIQHLIDRLPASVEARKGSKPSVMSGPHFVTREWKYAKGWTALPERWFYPLTWKDAARGLAPVRFGRDVRAVHYFHNKRRENRKAMPDPSAVTTYAQPEPH